MTSNLLYGQTVHVVVLVRRGETEHRGDGLAGDGGRRWRPSIHEMFLENSFVEFVWISFEESRYNIYIYIYVCVHIYKYNNNNNNNNDDDDDDDHHDDDHHHDDDDN